MGCESHMRGVSSKKRQGTRGETFVGCRTVLRVESCHGSISLKRRSLHAMRIVYASVTYGVVLIQKVVEVSLFYAKLGKYSSSTIQPCSSNLHLHLRHRLAH
jgi:hypothetical protein